MAEERELTPEEQDRIRRMKWWHEAKFGMFIHWGLYSVIGRHEWVMEMEAIPVAEYEQLTEQFNPKPFPAREWAKLAKRTGMKYMVMTTKHHEGFCLFDTQYTDYCAPKVCGRDLVAEYVEAARSEGLRVGFYHSLMDWHHPDGARCVEDEAARKRFIEYIHGQVRELCTNYGKLDILWYDVNWPLSAEGWESAKMNRMVRELQPDIIINNRSGVPEDFSTPEQHITAESAGRAWEACMTMNESWGYHQADDAWKTPKQIIRNLIICARDGGNYLFNIGPQADGSVPEESVRILNAVGEWMDKYGETIYAAESCDVKRSLFADFTRKGTTLYLHIHFWPGEEWAIGGLQTRVKSARLLPRGEPVEFEQNEFRVCFKGLPAEAPDDLVSVLALECESVPTQDMIFVRKNMPRGKV
ncbi:MAG: alpha-L-fucosidase [Candidatus Latescibacteria bacterium]|nr:alpha-L-fucosidase [Candidatus Latescibacterota bacterium]